LRDHRYQSLDKSSSYRLMDYLGLFQFALEAALIVGAGHARDQEVRGHGPLLHLQNYGRI